MTEKLIGTIEDNQSLLSGEVNSTGLVAQAQEKLNLLGNIESEDLTGFVQIQKPIIGVYSSNATQQQGGIGGGDPTSSSGKLTLYSLSEGPISALRCVYLSSDGHVDLGDPLHALKSQLLGISITSAGSAEQQVTVQTFGILTDSFFNWPINTPLYMGLNGIITADVPRPENMVASVKIGFSLGTGSIYVKIERALIL